MPPSCIRGWGNLLTCAAFPSLLRIHIVITESPMTALERRSVGALSLLYVLRMLGLFMVLPLMALYAADLPGATPLAIGLALGAYGLTQAILQIPLGWLSDKVGRKRVIVGGLLMFAFGSVIAALADSVGDIILGRALQGAGAIASTVLALVADLTREEQRTKAMAMVGISIGVAFAFSLVLGPLVASFGGLAAVFWLSAGLAFLGVSVIVFWVPSPPAQAPAQNPVQTLSMLASLRLPGLPGLNFGVFTLHFVLMAAFLVVPAFLETRADLLRESHWLVYLPVLALSLLGMVPLMTLAERKNRPAQAFSLALLALAAALMLIQWASSAAPLYLGLLLFFVGFNYLEATLPSRVSKLAPSQGRGSAMGVYSTCQFLGAFCGGAVGGWTLQVSSATHLLLLCLCLVIAWLVIEVRYTSHGVSQEQPSPTR